MERSIHSFSILESSRVILDPICVLVHGQWYTPAVTLLVHPPRARMTSFTDGLDRSPMVQQRDRRVGPGIAIEPPLCRQESHQVFLEPEGLDTRGLSERRVDLPAVRCQRSDPFAAWLENAHIMRPGYAIEYDTRSTWIEEHARPRRSAGFSLPVRSTARRATKSAARSCWRSVNASAAFAGPRDQSVAPRVLVGDLVAWRDQGYRIFTSRASTG